MVAIIDYGLGNVRSVAGAVDKLGYDPLITGDAVDLERADKLILPGVGAFGDGMRRLSRLGLVAILNRLVHDRAVPILGICLGAQLMTRESNEFGRHEGLGWIDAVVEGIAPADPSLRIPHVGWNSLRLLRDDPLLAAIPEDALFYFVHSFHIRCDNPDIVKAECDYGAPIASVIHQNNVFGTQFHPEKSQLHGLRLLENFLAA